MCAFFGPAQNAKCAELWVAIRRSSGFKPDFARWAWSEVGVDLNSTVDNDELSCLYEQVSSHAHRLARARWKDKKTEFSMEVEHSWKAKGGRLPFGLLREKPLPPVNDLKVCLDVKLAPQRWSPVGKAWILVTNTEDFEVGDLLCNQQLQVTILDKRDNYLQVNRLLSRREAAGLVKTFTTADPERWCPHFLDKWSEFWQRDVDADEASSDEYLHLLPQSPPQSLGPLSWEHWTRALKSAKTGSMRGTDSWSISELRRLPRSLVEILLTIFDAVEGGNKWPEQLTHWKLIVLRKSSSVEADWTVLRPISVAGMLYRLWARMRTAQFLQHCATFKRPLVSPTLSTRAVWCFIADKIDFEFANDRKLCGVVLDIIKCYNAVHRRTLFNAMKRLGFCPRVLRAWSAALDQMARSVLINGFSYGHALSSTGIPEGDPLSNAGMFCLSYWYSCFAQQQANEALAVTYADNWECLFGHVRQLLSFLPELERFLSALRLPVNPTKCWSWSLDPEQRKVLKAVHWCGGRLPVKLQARELGADLAYCLRKAAAVRNTRIQATHQRLLRLGGLPSTKAQKQRLLLGGIWPQGLHAAETATVPRSVFKRLRTQTSLALNMARKGSNPFLVCLLACPRIVDPQFVLLCNRIMLFRQVLRELPSFKDMFLQLLNSTRGRYKGPTRIMVRTLSLLGWDLQNGAVFADHMGRVFHLFLSPFKQIYSLLSSSWADYVCVQVDHRKGLEYIEGIDLQLTKAMPGLLPSEKGLVLCQQTGAFFTEDTRKHCGGSGQCPKCEQLDSRQHRLEECVFVQPLRDAFPTLMAEWSTLPDSLKLFGLVSEPEDYRLWQKCLVDIPFPQILRSTVQEQQIVYTDGSCLFPRWEHLRVASYAAIRANTDGTFDVISQGLLPTGFHSAYRAEIFGLAVAVRTFTKVVVSLDCKGVVDTARLLIDQKLAGYVTLPRENADLWAYFLESLEGCALSECHVRWVRGHQSWTTGPLTSRVDAWFNHWADRIAGVPGHWLSRNVPMYRKLIKDHKDSRTLTNSLFRFHAAVALAFAGSSSPVPHGPLPPIPEFCGFGDALHLGTVDIEACHVYHQGFARKLLRWLSRLRWFPRSSCGSRTDTSWLEIFWGFLFDTMLLPPVYHGGEWLTVDDDEAVYFVLPPVRRLFAVWKRHLDSLCRGGLTVPWVSCVPCVDSVKYLGCRFRCSGIGGFVPVARSALCDLSLQFHGASCLRDLRIPFVN